MIYFGLISHLIADFLVQPKKLIEWKQKDFMKGNLIHAFIVWATYMMMFLVVVRWIHSPHIVLILVAILLAAISHFGIDIGKTYLLKQTHNKPQSDLVFFLLDQCCHFLVNILLFYYLIKDKFSYVVHSEMNLIFVFLFVIFIGDFTIRKIFTAIELKNYVEHEEEIKGIGSLIGKIERTIILAAILFGNPTIAIAVIGIKSIARFPEMNQNHERKNDYFILGNLLSILFVMIGFSINLFL